MVDVDIICLLNHLKVELAWATDKRLQVIINTIMLFLKVRAKKLKKELFKYCLHCYVALSNEFK